MLEQDLNPRDREWPENRPRLGEVVEHQFFECESGPKVISLLEHEGAHYLSIQDCQVRHGEVYFGSATWLRVEDGTARLALVLANRMLRGVID